MNREGLRREIVQIAVLIVVAVGAFVATQAVAAHSRQTTMAEAAEWYARGQREFTRGNSPGAIEDFRRAAAKNRDERTYALALARALERDGDAPAAERALLALRDSAPEDSEVNLELARLAASGNDLDEALRYYRNALYAPAAAVDPDTRRAVRLELIRLLLTHQEKGRALAELLAAIADSPNDAVSTVELGRLLIQAGDDRRASDQFARALRLDPQNIEALVGAGTAAFHQGQYPDARRYLRAANVNTGDAADLLTIADLIVGNDPLGPRLGSAERQRRLVADLRAVASRLEMCGSQEARSIAGDIEMFAAGLRPRDRGDSDVLTAGLEWIDRGEQSASPCGEPSHLDRALVLIARLHGATN